MTRRHRFTSDQTSVPSELTTHHRRAFLAASGTIVLSGCTTFGSESASSDDPDSSEDSNASEDSETSEDPDSSEDSDASENRDSSEESDPSADEGEDEDEEETEEDSDEEENEEKEEPKQTTIGFGGDTMLGRDLNDRYGQPEVDPAAVWGDFQSRLQSLDAVCCNLECCLSTRGEPYPGRTYHFRGDPEWAVPALDAGNVQFASLANNHAMDYGAVALTDTIDALEENGINVAGAGETPDAAHAPTTFSVGDVDVAVVSFTDHPSGYAATDDRPGVAFANTDPDDPDTQRIVGNAIERAKAHEPDLLVASVHWGWNWVEEPGEELRAFGHWLVDQGVDLVHGHSAHVVQAVEQYGDGVILHDTGDLVDDFGVKGSVRNDRSFLFEVTLEDGQLEQIRLVPIEINDMVSHASDEVAAWLRETIRDRSSSFETTYERDGTDLVVTL